MQASLNSAHDGDTITLPAGTFSWTSRLEITKGITLQGVTTISGAGSANPTINDGTIVKDDTRRTGSNQGIIRATMRSNQSFRLTGITFSAGASNIFASGNGAIHLRSQGSAPCTSMRVDHCHFNLLYQGKIILVSGWVYGVADHNVLDVRNGSFPFHIWHDTWGGASQVNGNGSWADYPWYGTEKFFFMEDNTARESSVTGAKSFVDTFYGGRWVARHNYLLNCIPNGHGTEGGEARGQRANEFYDNTVKMTVPWSGGGQRSGTSLWHDNLFIGVESSNNSHSNLANYRETPARPHPVWGIADGTSVWDQNDTEGNGTLCRRPSAVSFCHRHSDDSECYCRGNWNDHRFDKTLDSQPMGRLQHQEHQPGFAFLPPWFIRLFQHVEHDYLLLLCLCRCGHSFDIQCWKYLSNSSCPYDDGPERQGKGRSSNGRDTTDQYSNRHTILDA